MERSEELKKVVEASAAEKIKELQKEAVNSCGEEIKSLLEKYNCELFAVPGITIEGKIVAEVSIRYKG